jgi:hypothetical protein
MGHEAMRRLVLPTALGALCVFGAQQAQAQHAAGGHQMTSPAELKWADVAAMPGAQITVIQGPMNEAVPFIARIKFPANTKVPAHSHGAIEHATVVSGVLNMGVGEKLDTSKTQALGVGSVSIMQPGTNHFAWFGEETVLQLHGVGPWTVTYVNPADDPRKK